MMRPPLPVINHPPPYLFSEQKRRGGVNIQEMLPDFPLQFGDRQFIPPDDGPGVVDQDVDAPVMGHHPRHHRIDLGGVAQIAIDRKGAAAGRLHLLGHRVNAAPFLAHFGRRPILRRPLHIR